MRVARIVLSLVAGAMALCAASLPAQEPQGTRRPKLVVTEIGGRVTTLQPGTGLNDGTDDGSATRGKDVFASAGCGAAIAQWGGASACGVASSTCNPCSAHAYLQLSTAGMPVAEIASAQIQLYFAVSHWNCGRAWPQDPIFGLRRVTGSWDEMALDWNNQPSVDAALVDSQTFTGVAGLTPVTAYKWLTYDITELYRGWANGSVPNYGVRISHENPFCFNCDSSGFFSSDDGRTAITYSGPTAGEPGVPVTVSATIVEAGAGGVAGRTLSFTLGGQACSATTDATGHASCLLTPAGAGAQPLTASFAGDVQFQASSSTAAFQVGPASPASPQGLWWSAPAGSESGWGINFAHQGNIIFATWFTYGEDGAPWWLAMVAEQTAPNVYKGDLFTTTGPPFAASPFDPALVHEITVGAATITFTDARSAVLDYTVTLPPSAKSTTTQTKNLTLQEFGAAPICQWNAPMDPALATNYQDLWWNDPPGSESGWGINLTHQGNTIFATWFTYDANGKPWWLAFVADKTAPGVYTGDVFTTTGPPFNAVPFDPSKVVETTIGTATLTFSDGNHASFAYTVSGVSQTKTITRQVFVAPGTLCQ